jgi:hypothetical protein
MLLYYTPSYVSLVVYSFLIRFRVYYQVLVQ